MQWKNVIEILYIFEAFKSGWTKKGLESNVFKVSEK